MLDIQTRYEAYKAARLTANEIRVLENYPPLAGASTDDALKAIDELEQLLPDLQPEHRQILDQARARARAGG